MTRDYTPKRDRAVAGAAVALRCKRCASRFEVKHPQVMATCPKCQESWRIRWFTPDAGMITAPADWSDYQVRARGALASEQERT